MSSKAQKGTKQTFSKKSPTPVQQLPDPISHLNPKQKISYFLTNIEQKIINEIDEHKQAVSSNQSPFFEDEQERVIRKNQERLKKLTEQRKMTQKKYKELAEQQFELKHEYKAKLKQKYYESRVNESRDNQSRQYIKKDLNNQTQRLKLPTNISQQNQFLNDFKAPHQSTSLKTIHTNYKLRPKSQLTTEDINKLKKLKQQYNKFQEEILMKTLTYNEDLERIRKENLQFEEMMKKEKNEKKKKEIELKLQDLQRLKQERINKYQQQRIRLTQVKKKPKRFQKLMKEFQNKQKLFQQQKVSQMKMRLKHKFLDFTQINYHQKRYEQLKQQQLKEIQQRYQQHSQFLRNSRFEPVNKSRFYKSVLEEERQRKLSLKKKQLETIEKCQRVRSYAQKVSEEYAPRLKSRENQQEQETKSQTKEDRTLSLEDRQKLGNNYLKQVIKHLKQQKQQYAKNKTKQQGNNSSSLSFHAATTSKSSNLPPISSLSTKYKDYLSQQRTKQGSPQSYQESKQKRAKLKYTRSIEQVKNIMNEDFTKKNSRRYETIDKIKEITERLEYGGMEGDYIDKIRAKLEILETIM